MDTVLADGIDLPIVAALGIATFGPLTLLVTCIECLVFKLILKVSMRAAFMRLLWANIASTLAAAPVLMLQNLVVHETLMKATIPTFIHAYVWAALLIVLVYWLKSVVVEGLIVSTPRFAAQVDRPRDGLFRATVAANLASYCLVGPLFYFVTRPTFGGIDARESTEWTTNPGVIVYFIDPADNFIKSIRMDGREKRTLVPYPATAFSLTGEPSTFAYRGTDGHHYFYRPGDAAPAHIAEDAGESMQSVAIAPDSKRVAYVRGHSFRGHVGRPMAYRLGLFDVDSKADLPVPVIQTIGDAYVPPRLCWSSDGSKILMERSAGRLIAVAAAPPWEILELPENGTTPSTDLAEGYLRTGRHVSSHELREDSKADFHVEAIPYLGAYVEVTRQDETVLRVANDYGLLKLGLPAPACPAFLPSGPEILVQWGDRLYVLGYENNRLGFLTEASYYIARLPKFRIRLE